ncbi:alpha/beta fold hydrolase [Rhizobium rhizogenes]|uniref:alpha/beta fold hydrolase n=1 Tax=Rhizobium rhizogenes TaxID=359 RepID=UPI001F371D22|nr:alpha/beta hydrolase [Rhizobium rhizogenes]
MKQKQPHAPLRGFDQVVNGRKVHVMKVGDDAGPPIVLLHGCGSLAQEVLTPFRNAGLDIVAPDRPSYGFSDPLPQGQRGPLGQSRWLEEFVDALGFGSLTIAGHSIGCAPAILLAQRCPDLVKSLVLIAPFCRPTPEQTMVLLRLAVAPGIGGLFSQQVLYRFADYFGGRVMRKAHHPNPVPDTLTDFPYRHAASPQSLRMMADELLQFNVDMAAVGDEPITCMTDIGGQEGCGPSAGFLYRECFALARPAKRSLPCPKNSRSWPKVFHWQSTPAEMGLLAHTVQEP